MSADLAVNDIKVLITEVLEHFVDVFFLIKQGQRMQQVPPAELTEAVPCAALSGGIL